MIRIDDMVKVESRADWDSHYNATLDRFDDSDFPHNIDLTSFPIYMKICEPWNPQCRGYYTLTTKDNWDTAKDKKLKELRERIRMHEKS